MTTKLIIGYTITMVGCLIGLIGLIILLIEVNKQTKLPIKLYKEEQVKETSNAELFYLGLFWNEDLKTYEEELIEVERIENKEIIITGTIDGKLIMKKTK